MAEKPRGTNENLIVRRFSIAQEDDLTIEVRFDSQIYLQISGATFDLSVPDTHETPNGLIKNVHPVLNSPAEAKIRRFKDRKLRAQNVPILTHRMSNVNVQTQDDSCCWTKLFDTLVTSPSNIDIFTSNTMQDSETLPKRPGILMHLRTLLVLEAMTHEIEYDGGIVFVGFETALIPMQAISHQPTGVTRWHFICSSIPGTQIDYRLVDVSSRLKVHDSDTLFNTKAWVGWTDHAIMLLGSERISVDLITASASAAVRAGTLAQGVKTTSSQKDLHKQLPCRAAFSASSSLPGILNEASKMYFIFFDTKSGQSWFVPALNFLIFAVACYLHGHGYDEPYPFYSSELHKVEEVEASIRHILRSPDFRFTKDGQPEITMEDIGTADSNLLEGVIVGIELHNIILDGSFELKEVQCAKFPSSNAWKSLNREFFLIFCNGIGDLILPMQNDIQRASKTSPDEWMNCKHVRAICGTLEWEVTGEPFAQCTQQASLSLNGTKLSKVHCGTSRLQQIRVKRTCDREERAKAKITQMITPIPVQGAVRFGLSSKKPVQGGSTSTEGS
ncbi:hypothetical protein BDZ91DRAFT_797352 [Kalaharituber pfeilii]|nr:hypothetical protein BDZ91DRAFT_797352 [Kalaharituber pfeilii]